MSKNQNTHYTNLQPGRIPVPIVAIGGSAGGQQAMSELLSHLPPDTGLAFVYIQHLSPDYDSKLDLILSAKTSMQVLEAAHLMPVRPNQLYVIPPGKTMEVIDGVLVLIPRKTKPKPHLPVDHFFCSLAERQKDGAIGIVLSGMASDGTLGLKAIKVAGGITFAQDETAAFQGMPQSAIIEGVVDMVLPPRDIAAELSRLSNHKDVFQLTAETNEAAQDDTDNDDLRKILAFVKSAAGVDFTNYKKSTIRRRIIRRMLLYKIDTLAEYIDYLKKHPAEAGILYNDMLINVTNFFRDAPAMEFLKEQILPQVIRNKPVGEAIRIWVAGCSTGQEAYSLAMMTLELLGDRAASLPVQIFATDLSDTAIFKARLGIFTKGELTDVSPERLERFFSKVDDHYRVNKLVRDLCVFAPHNLLSDPPFSRIDLISCRNLLIYLDDALQKKVFATFHYALKPDGYLLLGKSESVGSSPAYFTQIEKAQKVFMRKNNTQTKIPLEMAFKSNSPTPQVKKITTNTSELVTVGDLDKLVDNLLLSQYVPASVVIDQDLEIIQFRGVTTPFLQPASGKASLNLTKMAHPSLVFELRNIVHKARKSAERQRKDGLEISYPGKPVYVNIEAVPIANAANQQLFLVLFEQVTENVASISSTGDTGHRNSQLEAELTALRQDMHSIVEEQEASNEELQSANEEIVSSNEELQSINEELETSKEEIESANEELQTINQELQTRNDQLTESYEYSEAILSTINEATLVLDEHMRVKSANQAFYRFFLTDAEKTEGHFIYELSNRQFDFAGFRDLLHQVISYNMIVKGLEADVRISAEQRTMLIHARKLTLHQKQIILLGFEDITVHRRQQRLLNERRQWFEGLVNNSPAMIWVCQADGKINFLNKAWVNFTGHNLDKNEAAFYEAVHPADLPSYQATFSKNLGRQAEFSFEYRLKRSDGAYRWVLENASPVFSEDGTFDGYTGSAVDIHLQKTLTEQLNHHVDEKTMELRSANQQLSRTADRLQSVLNGVPASVTLMEPVYAADDSIVTDFIISVFNDKTLEFTGQNSRQIQDKTLLEVTPFLKEAGLFEKYVHVLQTGETAYQEFSALPSQVTLAYLITRQVDKTGIVVTALDITARKQAEIKLTEVAESLQAVLDSSPASIAFFKAVYSGDSQPAEFILAVCNQKFSKDFGKPVTELMGTAASGLLSLQHQQYMRDVYSTKAAFYEEHLLDGHPKWLATSMSRHDHGVAVTELDITLLKESSFQQTKLIKQLQSSNEMIESLATMKEYVQHRGAFLRSSFHDLRGSFGIIIGATSLFNMMDTQQERERVLDMLQRNLTQVSQMMNQLLDYSRLESGEERLHVKSFDAAGLLTELCSGSSQLAQEKGLFIHFEGPDQLTVEGDDVKVRRIAQNLILNAVKYTTAGGVKVSWGMIGPNQEGVKLWELNVSDTGPGIPRELLAKLDKSKAVQPNQDHQANTEGHGEGIGLFIIRRLTELLDAKMEIRSEMGQGTAFHLIFPQSYLTNAIKE